MDLVMREVKQKIIYSPPKKLSQLLNTAKVKFNHLCTNFYTKKF